MLIKIGIVCWLLAVQNLANNQPFAGELVNLSQDKTIPAEPVNSVGDTPDILHF